MKLTESTNICYFSDRVACTTKWNIKENFLENNGFARICYSVTTLGNPWTHVKHGWYYKVWQPIINPSELLLETP